MLHSWQWLDGGEMYWHGEWMVQGNSTLRRTSHCLRGPQGLNRSRRWPSFGIGKVCCGHGHEKHPQDNDGCFLVLLGQEDYCPVLCETDILYHIPAQDQLQISPSSSAQ